MSSNQKIIIHLRTFDIDCIVLFCWIVGLGGTEDTRVHYVEGREEERAAVQSTNLRTKAEPQQIVAQRLLSCLQYPVPAKSFTEDLTQPTFHVVF